uniref:GCK domain-containing protein n=1 Tax=Oryza punctata TaxID=4537 RepID=A0A0E0KGU4_ORYPU
MATAAASSSAPPPPPPAEPAAHPPAKEEPQHAAAEVEGETVILDAAAGEGAGKEGEEEEEGECGFCLFMKGGGCKEEFVGWEKCVEDAEKAGDDVVERCYEVTAALHKCMEAHPEYYHPILSAERAMAADLEAAKASDQAAEASDAAASSQQPPTTEEEAAGEKKQAEEALVPEKQDVAA